MPTSEHQDETERVSLCEGDLISQRYRLGERLGTGGMGVVFEGRQLDLDRRVAIKVLHRRLADDSVAITRFEREALAAAAVGHPNIVSATDLGYCRDGRPFLVMDYVEGQTLQQMILGGEKLPPHTIVALAIQLLSALSAAHRAKIIHRDIKPSNVMVLSTPGLGLMAKVMDFGIAKLLAADLTLVTEEGTAPGSPLFMSPEQATAQELDQRTDIYSLGASLFFTLTGKLPFEGTNPARILSQIVTDPTPHVRALCPEIPEQLDHIVAKAMAKERSHRYQSADEMIEDLEPWVAGPAAHGEQTPTPAMEQQQPAEATAPEQQQPAEATAPASRISWGAEEQKGRAPRGALWWAAWAVLGAGLVVAGSMAALFCHQIFAAN